MIDMMDDVSELDYCQLGSALFNTWHFTSEIQMTEGVTKCDRLD